MPVGDEGATAVHGRRRSASSLARAHTAARSIGLARGALEDAIAYARERVQFGQPIGDFQAIRFKIANMATEIEAARQLMYYVCSEIDAGQRRPRARPRWSSCSPPRWPSG